MANYWSIKKSEKEKEKLKKLKGRRDQAFSKAVDKSMEQGADSPFDMGVGTETRAYKKSERLTGKLKNKYEKYKKRKSKINKI